MAVAERASERVSGNKVGGGKLVGGNGSSGREREVKAVVVRVRANKQAFGEVVLREAMMFRFPVPQHMASKNRCNCTR